MNGEPLNIESLLLKYLKNELTAVEEEALNAWKEEAPENQKRFEEWTTDALLVPELKRFAAIDQKEGSRKLHRKLNGSKNVLPLHSWRRYAAAAAFILVCGTGGYVWLSKKSILQQPVAQPPLPQQDVNAPAGNRAVITLANKDRLYLDNLENGTVAVQGNVVLVKRAGGGIEYQMANGTAGHSMLFNTLTNPRGSTVAMLTLADGTKAWLNAGSSLTYPAFFAGAERTVSITGEAYFEVAPDRLKPFIVRKDGMTVQVLGTHFNVNAYNDEARMKTTLLEGSVAVTLQRAQGPERVVLRPGQQAQLSTEKIEVTSNVDSDAVMAWKTGLFLLDGTDLPAIMRQISRWYDVDVAYLGAVPDRRFEGGISKNLPLSKMLALLEANGLRFRQEGRKLVVLP